MEIKTRNTNALAPAIYRMLQKHGVETLSRNGPVLRYPEPVSVCIEHPWERVHFCAQRDANPFFHLIEALAMLLPLNDAELMTHFASNMMSFSDDKKTFNAFYGTRARQWGQHSIDQVETVIQILSKDPTSRQCVVQLWEPEHDLGYPTLDKACNQSMLFDIQNGSLCMTTFNRSNDAVLGGISGANIVHLPFFQEYVAKCLELPMGRWWHISNNLHAYTNQRQWQQVKEVQYVPDQYALNNVESYPLFSWTQREEFDLELVEYFKAMLAGYKIGAVINHNGFHSSFFKDVAVPMYNAIQHHKQRERMGCLEWLSVIPAGNDWRLAAEQWCARRHL